jgi:hypothetical protein
VQLKYAINSKDHVAPNASPVNVIYQPTHKRFEREDTRLADGQLAINSGVKHSYDLCIVHGVLSVNKTSCVFSILATDQLNLQGAKI